MSSAAIFKGSIDAHQHFWQHDPQRHNWINDEMAVIRKDFMPQDLQPVLQENGIEGCVAVQVDQTDKETEFLLGLSEENDFMKGVVGWVDLQSTTLDKKLEEYAVSKKLKGFRHILQGEDPSFMLQSGFLRGIGKLAAHHFTYDILIYPNHLTATLQLVQQFSNQLFVIDHMAKPYIKNGLLGEWKKGMAAIAAHPNVYCKISGMVTEADMRGWKQKDFDPYLEAITTLFGVNRVMYGSDWPVCLAAGSYQSVLAIVKKYFADFSAHEQQLIFGGNASAFYHLI